MRSSPNRRCAPVSTVDIDAGVTGEVQALEVEPNTDGSRRRYPGADRRDAVRGSAA
jgi:hypothetical protein